MKHTLKDWIIATRPWSFPASAMPVIVTIFWLWAKGYDLNWGLGVMALVNIILIHAAGNVWSDYFDFKKGVDAIDTYGVKILTTGQFTPSEVMRLSVGIQIAAILMGVVMVLLTGLPLLWIGLIGVALSLLYPTL
ncbi:MAG: prenyltransferase, partial [Bacteroidales bacterium]|nr:prenyltransferase [Bacteroidales bacterium]